MRRWLLWMLEHTFIKQIAPDRWCVGLKTKWGGPKFDPVMHTHERMSACGEEEWRVTMERERQQR